MKTREFHRFLDASRISVFTIRDAARILGKPKHYSAVFLSRDPDIVRAERGVYYTRMATEYEVASSIVSPSYVSLISALRFHNLTEQIPIVVYIISPKRHRPIDDLNGKKVEFKKAREKMMFGYKKIDGAFVADPEKAVVDMLYFGMFEEYADELIESGRLDVKRLMHYAELSGNASLMNTLAKKLRALAPAMEVN